MITALKNKYYRNLQKKEMVQYWKYKDAVEAKIVRAPEGHVVMYMEGEKYPFPGHPRGTLLYGNLSPLKHEIKNRIFNAIHYQLAEGKSEEWVRHYLRTEALPYIYKLVEENKYDLVPFEQMNPPIKELYRAMTKVGVNPWLKEAVCLIFQEDDAYRWRFQWLTKFFPHFWKPSLKHFEKALSMIEHAEEVDDMKERERLWRNGFLFMLKDHPKFWAFVKEVNWNKLRLTKADKYFFRAKWFKVDFPEYGY